MPLQIVFSLAGGGVWGGDLSLPPGSLSASHIPPHVALATTLSSPAVVCFDWAKSALSQISPFRDVSAGHSYPPVRRPLEPLKTQSLRR